ncbi:hypothetical protein CPC08DRAFT_730252 [Agrocybe pediades]|nr:hypothetical protein CPC08DRAFT_730252 [Agrocybe pediades]
MVIWENLRQCTNPTCKVGCKRFYPQVGEEHAVGRNALGLVCLCDCFGNQHEEAGSGGSTIPPHFLPPEEPATAPTPNMDEGLPQRPAGKNFSSFLDAAKQREHRKQAGEGFNPSAKIHQQNWTKQTNQADPRKKRTQTVPSDASSSLKALKKEAPQEPSSASHAKGAKLTSAASKPKKAETKVSWTVFLFPITSLFEKTGAMVVQPREGQ